MPLTNPNKVVTEQRLADFYGEIYPYLGGMPEMLANKFSKGDLYSTDEKMIGQWTDGKPLYQKTFVLTNISDWAAISLGLTDIDIIIKKDNSYAILSNGDVMSEHSFYATSSTKSYYTIMVYKTSNNQPAVYITKSASVLITKAVITVQYTKTTDSPISIGSDTDYSTDEKIIGTWIDGKPIYQKVITGLSLIFSWVSTNKHALVTVSPLLTDYSLILGFWGINSGEGAPNEFAYINYYVDGRSWKLLTFHAATVDTVVIQYTKTTD